MLAADLKTIQAGARAGVDAYRPLESGNGHLAACLGIKEVAPIERRILQMLAVGKTRAEIACELGVSPVTVGHWLTTAKEKMGARTITEAVVVLVRSGSI